MREDKYAIIDIGSNTMRLVIYVRDKSGKLKEIENVKAVARLRNYLTEDSHLSIEGMTKLITTLHSFQEITRHHYLKDVKCVATATIRQAVNKTEIEKQVKEQTDFTMQILSEYEEAYYGFLAIVNSTSLEEGITIDIGGGSTEITYFKNRELKEYHSFSFGALSLKKEFVSGNFPSEDELQVLRSFLSEQFASLPWLKDKNLPIIAIGGSARNVVQIHQAIISYPLSGVHQYVMSGEQLEEVKQYLLKFSFEEMQKVDGLSKDRADIIIPALETFQCLYEIAHGERFIVSRKGLRDGIFYEELTRDFGISIFPNVIEESLYNLAADYNINVNHMFHVTTIATNIYNLLADLHYVERADEDILDIKRGSFVYNLGCYIDGESSSQHTFYLLANRTIDGLFPRERLKMALIASYKSKPVFKQYIEPYQDWFMKEEQLKIRQLGAIVKFAYSLDTTKRKIVEEIKIEDTENGLIFFLECSGDWQAEQYQAEKQKKHLEKIIKKPITVNFHSI